METVGVQSMESPREQNMETFKASVEIEDGRPTFCIIMSQTRLWIGRLKLDIQNTTACNRVSGRAAADLMASLGCYFWDLLPSLAWFGGKSFLVLRLFFADPR